MCVGERVSLLNVMSGAMTMPDRIKGTFIYHVYISCNHNTYIAYISIYLYIYSLYIYLFIYIHDLLCLGKSSDVM